MFHLKFFEIPDVIHCPAVIIEFWTIGSDDKLWGETMKKYLSLMSKATKIKCCGIILLALIGAVLASIWPVQLGNVYSKITNGEINNFNQALYIVIAFGGVYLCAECIVILRRVLLDCVIATHEAEVREYSIEKLLKMPVAYYSGSLSGEKTAQLNQGVAGLSQLIKITCNDVIAAVLTATCTLIQVIRNAPSSMAGMMLMYLVVTVTVSIFQIRSQNGIRESIVKQKNALDGQICQSISNLELIRSMNAEKYETARLHPDIFNISKTERRHHTYMGSFDCVKRTCKVGFQMLLLLYSVLMIASGKMLPSAVITVCLLYQQLVVPIDEVYRFMDETASSLVKAKVLIEVVTSGEDSVFSIPSNDITTSSPDIILKNVSITNPEKDKVLAQYDSVLIPGKRIVALKGSSGCGKTTMIRSLTRYYPVESGQISLFGEDINNFSQKEIANNIFYLPQQPFFFAGTIRDNLVYGLDRDTTEKELIDALRLSCLLEPLQEKTRNISSKSNTTADVLLCTIGEGGTGLSGGERQRLSIARAFLRTPKVFVFDESTANLDVTTAKTVLNNLEDYAKKNGAGIVYISHDENVVERCDEVIEVMNKVKEDSTAM